MNILLISYYKEQGLYSIFYKYGKHVIVSNSRADNLRLILNGMNPYLKANLHWIDHYPDRITMCYELERR